MNTKDLLKYGLIALGVYLVWKYVEEQGGISNLFGATTGASARTPAQIAAQQQTQQQQQTQPPATTTTTTPPPPNTIPPAAPVLDLTGLMVVADINGSLTGTVKINGVPTRLSIITADGRIFDSTGTEITSTLQAEGIDVVALRTAFANAGAGLSGLGMGARYTPAWLM